MKFKENIFDLTEEQILKSKRIYNDLIIKCLIAPYHFYNQLEQLITYNKNIYLFPEREISYKETLNFMSLIVNNKFNFEEVIIITTNLNIIVDMIDDCVRILTEDDLIIPASCKTYMANIHTIKYELLDNLLNQTSKKYQNLAVKNINEIINKINNINETNKITENDVNEILNDINLIGESVLTTKLKSMISDKRKYIIKNNIDINDFIEKLSLKYEKSEEFKYHAKELVKLYRDMSLSDEEIIEKFNTK